MARGTWGSGGTDIHPLAVRISFRLGTSRAQTGFHLRDTSLTPANPQACADDVADWVNTSFKTIFNTIDVFEGVDVVDLTTGEGGGYSFANVTGTQAPATGERLPTYMMVPVSLKGELRRRYGQGRMMWPVRQEGYTSDDTLSATGVTAIQGVIDAMVARYLGSGSSSDYTLINVHGVIAAKAATTSSPPRAEVPPSWYDVTTVRLNTVLSFLRSRKAGVGS